MILASACDKVRIRPQLLMVYKYLYVIMRTLSLFLFKFFDVLRILFSVAKMIWNNLLEPVGAKSSWNPSNRLRCPSKESPFLMTDKNSESDDDNIDNVDIDVDKPFERIRSSTLVTKRRKRRKKGKRSSDNSFESLVYDNEQSCNIL